MTPIIHVHFCLRLAALSYTSSATSLRSDCWLTGQQEDGEDRDDRRKHQTSNTQWEVVCRLHTGNTPSLQSTQSFTCTSLSLLWCFLYLSSTVIDLNSGRLVQTRHAKAVIFSLSSPPPPSFDPSVYLAALYFLLQRLDYVCVDSLHSSLRTGRG